MAESTAPAAQADTESLHIPLPSNKVFDGLYQHIHDKLWPNWDEKKRMEFIRRTTKGIALTKNVPDVDILVRRPAYCRVLAKPYSIVSVTTGIAIWGLDAVKLRPHMERFLHFISDRLAPFPDTPADGYGQPPSSLALSRVLHRGHRKQAQRAIKKTRSPAVRKFYCCPDSDA